MVPLFRHACSFKNPVVVSVELTVVSQPAVLKREVSVVSQVAVLKRQLGGCFVVSRRCRRRVAVLLPLVHRLCCACRGCGVD